MEIRGLIRTMSIANATWGAPRIHGELPKLGIEVSQATVAKYMARRRKPPCQTWRTFLENHLKEIVSVDFLVVPTISFRVLFVFIVLAHGRRRVLHFNVTDHPTAEWTANLRSRTDEIPSPDFVSHGLHDFSRLFPGWIQTAENRPVGIAAFLAPNRAHLIISISRDLWSDRKLPSLLYRE